MMRRASYLLGLLILPVLAAAQDPQSQPTTRPAESDQQRIADLLALVEGPNSPEARRTGARELLRQGRTDLPPRLVSVLSSSANPAARIALAGALADLPQHLDPQYIEPLIAMLGAPDAATSQAASAALSAYRNGAVIPRLRGLAMDSGAPRAIRLGAIQTLGLMTQRPAVAALIEALDDNDTAIRRAALTALEQASGMTFADDVGAARSWWQPSEGAGLADWQQSQIERLVQQTRGLTQQQRALEARLVKAVRDTYLRAAEPDRSALLLGYLAEPVTAVRLAGLDLVQGKLADGFAVTPELTGALRGLLTDPEAAVRAAAIRTIASLRDESDAERFAGLLASERRVEVRLALVNALGYVGTDASVPQLLALVDRGDERLIGEAIAALGRLAERGVLATSTRDALATRLSEMFTALAREPAALRERCLWALSRLATPNCAQLFVQALDPAESVIARDAAVRGIFALQDPALADALIPVTADADSGVRKAAVEALAELGAGPAHLQVLWNRLSPETEKEAAVRQAAWRGVLRLLDGRPAAEIEPWLARLPEDGAPKIQRTIELLRLAEASAGAIGALTDRGALRARLAAHLALNNEPDEAQRAFGAALADLAATNSPTLVRVALDALRHAVRSDRYDPRLAEQLRALSPPLASAEVWAMVTPELERLVAPETVERALAIAAALQAHPPTALTTEASAALDDVRRRAGELRAAMDNQAVDQAVARLRAAPTSDVDRAAMARLGPRAVPRLRALLKDAISAASDPGYERILHDLLREIQPQWAGFPADADAAAKLRALDNLLL